MKITRIETFLAPPRWTSVRVETDDGAVGRGEPALAGGDRDFGLDFHGRVSPANARRILPLPAPEDGSFAAW
ncbi:hypothetical protein [Streptomyces sp. NPDC002104]